MMKFLEEIRINIGMDANEFYTALITLLGVLVPAVIAVYKSLRDRIENNLWDLHSRRESEFFYIYVLSLQLLLSVLTVFVVYVIGVMASCIKIGLSLTFFLSYIILTIAAIRFVSKRSFVKIRLFGDNKYEWLIHMPMIVFNLNMYTVIVGIDNDAWDLVVLCMLGIIECAGMWVFRARYIQYQYAGAIFYLNNGDVVRCKDISKITRRYKSLIIKEQDIQIRIKYDDITKVKYYGGIRIKFLKKEDANKDYCPEIDRCIDQDN